jgi:integrase
LSSEFLEPLGLDDLHLGLPDHALPRAVPVFAGHPSEIINQLQFNRRRVRQAAIPAASISSNARQLARFYHMLLRGGELDGVRVLQSGTIIEARKASSDGIVDAFIKRSVRWAQGFQLGGPSKDTHPLRGDEMRALRKLQRESAASPFVFTSERAAPFSTAGFAKMIERAGVAAKLGFKAHPHMLRHACGFALANQGHDTRALQAYLGHKNIQHTVRYTELAPGRFRDFWR